MDGTLKTAGDARAAQSAELTEKKERISRLLHEYELDALLISRNENVAWATAGAVDMRVGMHRETGPGSLLLTKDGRSFYLTTDNEAERFAAEEFAALDFEPLLQPWYGNDMDSSIRRAVGEGRVAGDVPCGGRAAIALTPYRSELTDGEVERYRWLGQQASEAVTAVVQALAPGISEREIQARLAAELVSRGLTPTVYLCAVDDRILRYRHAVPRDGSLERLAMVGFCARYTGLAVSITRFVHFGAMLADLTQRFEAMAQVNARLLAATRTGATSDALFQVATQAYADAGYAGAEKMHHQGGAAGYNEREWMARPGGAERVLRQQAFAWNPNFQGAKVEDTAIHREGKIEVLTRTPAFPVLGARAEEREFEAAGVMER